MADHMRPTQEDLERYLALGLTYREMQETWREETGGDYSSGAFAMAVHRAGLAREPVRHAELIPWSPIASQHMRGAARYWYDLLLWEAQRRAGTITERNLHRLEFRKAELDRRNGSVHYSPSVGWRVLRRESWHRDLGDGIWIVHPDDLESEQDQESEQQLA